MFVTIKINTNLPIGTVVQYDTTNQTYTPAIDNTYPLGVIIRAPVQDSETQDWIARACFAGACYALSNSNILDEGGPLNVKNGKVEVGAGEPAVGVVSPVSYGDPTRNAGDLVMIYLR
jgi:hypothetical protein